MPDLAEGIRHAAVFKQSPAIVRCASVYGHGQLVCAPDVCGSTDQGPCGFISELNLIAAAIEEEILCSSS